jgi:hypothetical protein
MIYRGAGFLAAVVKFGFSSTPLSPSPVPKSIGDTQEERRVAEGRGKGGGGRGAEILPQEILVLYKSFNTPWIQFFASPKSASDGWHTLASKKIEKKTLRNFKFVLLILNWPFEMSFPFSLNLYNLELVEKKVFALAAKIFLIFRYLTLLSNKIMMNWLDRWSISPPPSPRGPNHYKPFIKGTVSWDRFQKFWQQFTELNLTMGRGWFLNFLWASMILKRKKYIYCG